MVTHTGFVAALIALCSCALAAQDFLAPERPNFSIPLRRREVKTDEQQAIAALLQRSQKRLQSKTGGSLELLETPMTTVELKNFANTQFVGSVGVGTPPQYLDVIFDTGSANFWVNSALCEEESCEKRAAYDHSKSRDFQELGDYLEVEFGTGIVEGVINADTVTIAGIVIKSQKIGEITDEVGDVFSQSKFSGILGLAFPSMAAFDFKPVFDSMMSQGVLTSNIMSFYYSLDFSEHSSLTLGAIDHSKFKGSLTWVPLIKNLEFYWLIQIDDVRIGDKSLGVCNSGCRAAVDTGTSLLTAPSSAMLQMMNEIDLDCQALYKVPDIVFVINGQDYAIPAEDYVLTLTAEGEDDPGMHSGNAEDCMLAYMPLDVPPP
jgi:cathepsin D